MIRSKHAAKPQKTEHFRYWNNRRRWMGNLVPAIFWAPLTVGGAVLLWTSKGSMASGYWLLVSGQVLGWVALNFLGLFENKNMRRALYREFTVLKPSFEGWPTFVGYSSGPYSSWLDPHEDVGFLCLTGNALEFYGDSLIWTIERKSVKRIRFRPNVHSILGIGRWIAIEAEHKGKPVIFKLEPRDKDILLLNMIGGRRLKNRLDNWLHKTNKEVP
jgi:hypothetical protein